MAVLVSRESETEKIIPVIQQRPLFPNVPYFRPPTSKPAPIDLARKPFQSVAGLGTEDPLRIVPGPQPPVEVEFFAPVLTRSLTRRNAQTLESQNRPRYEQEVARPSLDCAGSGEEEIGKAVADHCQSKLVEHSRLSEQVDDVKSAAPITLRVVKPSQWGSQ